MKPYPNCPTSLITEEGGAQIDEQYTTFDRVMSVIFILAAGVSIAFVAMLIWFCWSNRDVLLGLVL